MRTVTSLRAGFATLCTTAALLAACGGGDDDAGFDDDDDTASSSSSGGNVIGGGGSSGTSGSSGGTKACVPNASQFEVPGNGCDDDADGTVDNATACDGSLDVAGNAGDFVKAMGLCKVSSGPNDWGVVSATFVQGHAGTNPPPEGQHGILGKFGNVLKPREGQQLGVLSSGIAREYESTSGQEVTFKWHPQGQYGQGDPPAWLVEQPDGAWTFDPVDGTFPEGFPKASAGCGEPVTAFYDPVVLRVEIRAPKNAKGLGFDFNFHSSEWPEFVCSPFNDSFVAYLTSAASPNGADNISYDAQNNPVGVNLGFFDRCDPGVQTGCYDENYKSSDCSGGPSELAGTGFGLRDESHYCEDVGDVLSGGATGWLTTQAPIQPGETITLEFILADTGDPILDSSILLDNFKWIEGETTTSTSRPPS